MTNRDRVRVIFHGAVVLLVGLLCGYPAVAEAVAGDARSTKPADGSRSAYFARKTTVFALRANARVVRSARRIRPMNTDRIDFISAYCDRWCERCAFTERCSAYACDVATAMCDGDLAAGIELAVGVPQPVGGAREKTVGERLLEQYEQPSEQEIAAAMKEEQARRERIESTELSQVAWNYTMLAHEWLKRGEPRRAEADPLLREAFDIVAWDSALVGAKLHRALFAREQPREEAWPDDDPVQNDANGSAKVALISLERSVASWRLIAEATRDAAAADLEALAARLRALAAGEFPRAMVFVRPGFDEPWR